MLDIYTNYFVTPNQIKGAILQSCRQILGEMWTFLPKKTRHFDKSGICRYFWLTWLYFYLWIGSELSTNIYMIERKVTFF